MAATLPHQVSTSDVDTPPASSPPPGPAEMMAATTVGNNAVPVTTQEGVGTDGEFDVWDARYSMRNFMVRSISLGVLSLAWIGLAAYAWEHGDQRGWKVITVVAGLVMLGLWAILLRRMVIVRFSHYYRLTNRRLFVSTGLFVRRRDQMELLRVQDVYTRQTLVQRWLSLGTVVVVSTEPHLPMLYLTGVSDPKGVMDLIWHHARSERDKRSVKVDAI